MTDADDLVQWLREQITGDRRLANAAHSRISKGTEQWTADGMQVRDASRDKHLIVKHSWPNEIDHIVRHDPRAVLAQCDAHERLLNLLLGMNDEAEQIGRVAPELGAAYRERFERGVQLLALAHEHRPGYREEWRP